MKRQLLIIAVLILIAAAINPLVAVMCLKSRTNAPRVPVSIQLSGEEAAAEGWPARGPHDQDWPAPTSLVISKAFGFVKIIGQHLDEMDSRNRFRMESHQMGWLLPVLEHRRYWWPRNDPAWGSKAESAPALNILWAGVVLTPVIAGSAVWLVLCGPFVGGRLVIRRSRRRRALCQQCGYPIDVSETCTECGADLSAVASDAAV